MMVPEYVAYVVVGGPAILNRAILPASSSSSSNSEMKSRAMARSGAVGRQKSLGKTWTKVTTFGHMAVTLSAQGFPACNGIVMGKKYKRYVETYKKARNFYKSTGSGLTSEEVAALE
ncbi:hypothetical protein R1sor_007533 [Riccia sorocarpa]|uniref:Uncharacterized protein n=1 Tax=Riccia sorocarpa TaxID=122646 RepID=A0ABD3HU71_9MARC